MAEYIVIDAKLTVSELSQLIELVKARALKHAYKQEDSSGCAGHFRLLIEHYDFNISDEDCTDGLEFRMNIAKNGI